MRPDESLLSRLHSTRVKVTAILTKATSHRKVSRSYFGILRDAASERARMCNAVGLAKAGCECRKPDSPRFKKYHKEPAASREMFFRKLKHFFLLLTEREGDESPLIPIPNVKALKKSLDVL